MIDIKVTKDTASVLVAAAQRQMPFAASRALNFTAQDIQRAEQEHVQATFILRRAPFVLRTVKINRQDFATKQKLVATIRIDPERNFLAKFEKGGLKTPLRSPALAVPDEARPRVTSLIPRNLRPKALRLTLTRTAAGKAQWKGLKRTFLVEVSTFNYGILQRVGRGRHTQLRVLYWFQRSVHIRPTLHFEAIGRKIAADRWGPNFTRAFNEAMATARL